MRRDPNICPLTVPGVMDSLESEYLDDLSTMYKLPSPTLFAIDCLQPGLISHSPIRVSQGIRYQSPCSCARIGKAIGHFTHVRPKYWVDDSIRAIITEDKEVYIKRLGIALQIRHHPRRTLLVDQRPHTISTKSELQDAKGMVDRFHKAS